MRDRNPESHQELKKIQQESTDPFNFEQILAKCEQVMDAKIDKKRKESFDEEGNK